MFFNTNKDFSFTLGFKVFNNYDFFKRTLYSLEQSNLFPNLKFLFLDLSINQPEIKNLILDFMKKYAKNHQVLFVKKRFNENDGYFDLAFELANTDSDYYILVDENCNFDVEWLYNLNKIISIQLSNDNTIFCLQDISYSTYQISLNDLDFYHIYNILESHDNFNVFKLIKESGIVISRKYLNIILKEDEISKSNFYEYLNYNLISNHNLKIIGPKNNLINNFVQ